MRPYENIKIKHLRNNTGRQNRGDVTGGTARILSRVQITDRSTGIFVIQRAINVTFFFSFFFSFDDVSLTKRSISLSFMWKAKDIKIPDVSFDLLVRRKGYMVRHPRGSTDRMEAAESSSTNATMYVSLAWRV